MYGDVAESLAARPPKTDFEHGLEQFARLILRTVVALVLFVLAANALLQRPFLESLLFAVALAVGLTPEFMPMITTITLARGAVRMARRHVIVKHLAAIDLLQRGARESLPLERDQVAATHGRGCLCGHWPADRQQCESATFARAP